MLVWKQGREPELEKAVSWDQRVLNCSAARRQALPAPEEFRLSSKKCLHQSKVAKSASNRPWNHERENDSLLKLYRPLDKHTVGIGLEIKLAPTKTKLSDDFPGAGHRQGFQGQEKPEGSPLQPEA